MNPILSAEHIILFSVILFAAGMYACWRSTAGSTHGIRKQILICRAVALVMLAAIAFDLGTWEQLSKEIHPRWSILIDKSQSMKVVDPGEKVSRWEKALETARIIPGSHGKNTDSDFYLFSKNIEYIKESDDLKNAVPDGETTDIPNAIESVVRRDPGGNRKRILILSDGRHVARDKNDISVQHALAQNIPIYAVCYGGDIRQKDMVLKADQQQQVAFVNQKVKIRARIFNAQLGNIAAKVMITDPSGKILGKKEISLPNDGQADIWFELKPGKTGYREYIIRALPWKGERNIANNEAVVGVYVQDDKIRVLAVEGVPHWDSKFLLQLLRKQAHFDVTSIYRVSGTRFYRIETDISRGRLTSDISVFPDNVSDLIQYDTILFGRGVEYFLSPSGIRALKTYVRDYGGSIIFSRGKPYHDEFPELDLLQPVVWGSLMDRDIRWQLTREGENSRLFGYLSSLIHERGLNSVPIASRAFHCPEVKPFSRVLIQGTAGIGKSAKSLTVPILIQQRLGRGMLAAVNADGLWQRDFFPGSSKESDFYHQFWNRVVQWAAIHGDYLPGRNFGMRLSQTFADPGEQMKVTIKARKKPERDVTPELRIYHKASLVSAVHPGRVSPNRWEALVSLDQPGIYQLEMQVKTGSKSEKLTQMLKINAPASEADNLSADPGALERICKLSGGSVISPEEVMQYMKTALPDNTKQAEKPAWKSVWKSSWDNPLLLLLLLSFFGAEWHLKRRNGLL